MKLYQRTIRELHQMILPPPRKAGLVTRVSLEPCRKIGRLKKGDPN